MIALSLDTVMTGSSRQFCHGEIHGRAFLRPSLAAASAVSVNTRLVVQCFPQWTAVFAERFCNVLV